MKFASIYKKENIIIIHSNSKTVDGFWIASDPFYHIDINQREELYQYVLRALDETKESVPNPKNWSEFELDFMAKLGYKSHKKFITNTLMCNVEEVDEFIRIAPTENKGNKNGFCPINGEQYVLSKDEMKEGFLPKLLEAFDKCE